MGTPHVAVLQPPPATPIRYVRLRRFPVRATAAEHSTSSRRFRRPQNVAGEFFVDTACIDCDTCRWMAPEMFTRVQGMSAVTMQPMSEADRVKALQALLACPTASIHTENPPKEILQVQKMFPLPIDESTIPGVYHCGYHSERSYGAASYLICHSDGNIMVDSPRFTEKLAVNIENLGGARYMFLTHKDDVCDHRQWAKRLKCERIIHLNDVNDSTNDVERKVSGNGPWNIGPDFMLVHTPGHTAGSVCLYYEKLKILFAGDHIFKSQVSDDLEISLMYNQQSVSLQLESIEKLLDLNFAWILPGHGRRIKFTSNEDKDRAIKALLARMANQREA